MTESSPRSVDNPDASSTTAPCLFCGTANRTRRLLTLRRPVLGCECGLVYTPPSAAAAASSYAEAYYRGEIYPDYAADRATIRRNAERALIELALLTPGRRLLDVGCALGFFLEVARERGWTTRGIEVSAYAAEHARRELGLAVEVGSIVSPPPDLGEFDVVTMWDVLEHLDRPDEALAQVRRRLHPRGVLALSTGDYGCFVRRVTGRRWRLFLDSTHVFFFTERTLRRLLAQAGFSVLEIKRRGKSVSLAMIARQLPLPFSATLARWLAARAWQPRLYVNLRDVMTVLAKPSIESTAATSTA